MKNLTASLTAMMILILVGLGCSQSETKVADASEPNSNSSSDDGESNSNTRIPIASKDSDDIAGSYRIAGKNSAGQNYQGDLTIRKQTAVYQFSWNVAGSAYDGVGVRDGDLIAVGYGAGENGKGCGAAIYKVGSEKLEGKLGGWGFSDVGTQTATFVEQNGNSGKFAVTGTDTDGSDYQGILTMTKAKVKGDLFQFKFNGGKLEYVGTGIRLGDHLGAGIGSKQCGYAVYGTIDGRLEAVWGIIGKNEIGTETARRR